MIAGLDVAQACYALYDPQVQFQALVSEGARVQDRQVLAHIEDPARSLLTVERTALNFLGRMAGIATLTRQFVEAVAGTPAVMLDTRKLPPGCAWSTSWRCGAAAGKTTAPACTT